MHGLVRGVNGRGTLGGCVLGDCWGGERNGGELGADGGVATLAIHFHLFQTIFLRKHIRQGDGDIRKSMRLQPVSRPFISHLLSPYPESAGLVGGKLTVFCDCLYARYPKPVE